jgi:hypothetical protein
MTEAANVQKSASSSRAVTLHGNMGVPFDKKIA